MDHKWNKLKCRTCGLRRLEVATTSSPGSWAVTAWALGAPARRMRLYAVKGGRIWSTFLPGCVVE
jgi:hypothetical protein